VAERLRPGGGVTTILFDFDSTRFDSHSITPLCYEHSTVYDKKT